MVPSRTNGSQGRQPRKPVMCSHGFPDSILPLLRSRFHHTCLRHVGANQGQLRGTWGTIGGGVAEPMTSGPILILYPEVT